jgi:GH43 family beta-xylosidase
MLGVRSCIVLLAFLINAPARAQTFTNPLLSSGADPSVISRNGFYYYMQTTGDNLTIWCTHDITDLRHAAKKVVWTPPPSGPYSREIWAPELHFLNGKWYIYFAADAGTNQTHRIWVLENPSRDPLGGAWTMKGELADPANKWAIDPTVFENKGQLYALWSGWADDVDGRQSIYIARMRNPWTIEGNRVLLSTPKYKWENFGDLPNREIKHVYVNEGPEILKHNGRIFLIYSGSGCWTDHYALGMLSASNDSDLMNPASWKKVPQAVFSESADAHAFGPGHNTFFESPDGKQFWIIYHANPEPNEGCGNYRSPRAQPFTWNPDGTPNFGTPVPLNTPIPKPSGNQY